MAIIFVIGYTKDKHMNIILSNMGIFAKLPKSLRFIPCVIGETGIFLSIIMRIAIL